MSYEYFIGGRYFRTKQKQAFISLITFLSIAGVTVGVMALIIVIAVMSGAAADFRSRILGVESHVILMKHGRAFTDYREIKKSVEEVEGVVSSAPFVYAQVMLRSSSGVSGAVLRGIDPDSDGNQIKSFDKDSLKKALNVESAGNGSPVLPGMILGQELADNLGIRVGDSLYVISPRGMLSPVGHVPAMRRFLVNGLFKSDMYEYDSSLAYVNMADAQRIMRLGDAVSGIAIRIDDIYNANGIAEKIESVLGFPYWTKDWIQMNKNLFSALKLEKTAMFVILTLIVLVAAFNIASTLIMMVMGKTRDIAILKAMGATDKSIRKIFIFKGMVIGSIGIFLGMALGFAGCMLLKKYKFIEIPGDVYYFTTLPVLLQATDVLFIGSAALLICFLSTLYPAHQAAKLNPVEAIRYG
ncbi:MAG: lipoprotein-releasing ABC transporter permease subunit [Desulfobacterales bacterium]|nr:lipoprotein-releasing ABC transporter permease subunit [Desulfobacterales bacterium]